MIDTCIYCGRPITKRRALVRNVLFFGGIAHYEARVAKFVPHCCTVDCARMAAKGRRLKVRPCEGVR